MQSIPGIRLPDTSRNTALAGKTVSSGGMNLTYDQQGFVEAMTNYGHKAFAGTERSVRAPSAEAVLASADREGCGGSGYDKAHFTAQELAHADTLRQWAAEGVMTKAESDYWIDDIRRKYGYTGGSTGMEYVALTFPKEEDPEERAADRRVYAAPAEPALETADRQAQTLPAEASTSAPAETPQTVPAEAAREAPAVPAERSVTLQTDAPVEGTTPWRENMEQRSRQESLLNELRAAGEAAALNGERQKDGLLSELLKEKEDE